MTRERVRDIELIEVSSVVRREVLRAHYPGREIIASDFYIEGIELDEEFIGGYRTGPSGVPRTEANAAILNVDHHAPTLRMQRRISSTNLALKVVAEDSPQFDPDALIVINHLDCDSILSSGILSGRLEPDPQYGEAAIAADHTGEENEIADLLQGIDVEMREMERQGTPGARDLAIPFNALEELRRGALGSLARGALEARLRRRGRAEQLVESGSFEGAGPLHFAVADEVVDGEFFPALLPDALLIMVAYPFSRDESRWQVKLRLGLNAPEGFSLHSLGIRDFDPEFGGRWNAGSNGRGGHATGLAPERYAEELSIRLDEQLKVIGPLP